MSDGGVQHEVGTNPSLRVITCDVAFDVLLPAEIVFQIVASGSAGEVVDERLEIGIDGEPVQAVEVLESPHQGRLHVVRPGVGHLTLAYRAEITAPARRQPKDRDAPAGRQPEEQDRANEPNGIDGGRPADYLQQMYLRPSRYCPSDHLVGFAVAEFGTGPDTAARTAAVTEWIRQRTGYVPGSSSVHDSAEDTLLTGVGTCRDFAHLGIALCRATGVPARFAAVYAPGLFPMDFHAVFETCEQGSWRVHDATGLAPRPSMVRIATGRDAADTAFAAVTKGIADLESLEVSATVGSSLPADDGCEIVELP
jgi:transglutaminase-like putative cysteine protease